LRPNLSEGLPFSKRIFYCSYSIIGIAIKKLEIFFRLSKDNSIPKAGQFFQ